MSSDLCFNIVSEAAFMFVCFLSQGEEIFLDMFEDEYRSMTVG